jgi:Icc-related predicted phosphoesterase
MIRLAAAGDIHVGIDSVGLVREAFGDLPGRADALLLAGDLTQHGRPEEAAVLARELDGFGIPVVAVLGNHDHHSDAEDRIRQVLEDVGVIVLEREMHELRVDGRAIGIVGAKGFGGGFVGASGSEFGEREMKTFMQTTRAAADDVHRLLSETRTSFRVLLLHYSPVRDTLHGEPPEIYPFLGSYLFAEAADLAGADLILHGHAHRGTEWGVTPGGIRVRNVSQPVMRRAYALFTIGEDSVDASPFTEAATPAGRPSR